MAGASVGARLEAVVGTAYRLGDSFWRTELATYPMGLPSKYTTHQFPWRLSTSTRCAESITATTRVSIPRPSLTFTQVDVHLVWVLGSVVLGVTIGGEATVAGVNCAGVVLVNGWDSVLILVGISRSVLILVGIPRMATNNSTVTSTGTGQVMRLFLGAGRWPRKHEHRGHTDAALATFWPHSGQAMSGIGPQGG